MTFKKGDNVKIICGKDKGKNGKILQVLKSEKKVVVEGLNLRYKHLRPKRQGEAGQRIMFPAPMAVSNVMLLCPKCGKPTRLGRRLLAEKSELKREKKMRICKKCQEVI